MDQSNSKIRTFIAFFLALSLAILSLEISKNPNQLRKQDMEASIYSKSFSSQGKEDHKAIDEINPF